MEADTLIAPAKINLHLEILGLRDDGYHELRTLFYPVSAPCDVIEVLPGPDDDFYIRCPGRPELETTSNILYKAWKAFGAATGFQPGIFVTLTKRIPMGGGLGGGSSDAAALLRWLNREAGDRALPLEAMIELAAGLGADVPFFLLDGPAWAGGIGEALTPAEVDLSGATLILACPAIHVDTAWAFRAWDEKCDAPNIHESLTSAGGGTKNPSPVSPREMTNDFEPVVFEEYPSLRDIKQTLLAHGAEHAAMSGSGASLFGIYRDRGSATSAVRALEKQGIEIFQVDCP
ncbi:4-diphosphocytidyl-2C-methyl-D-erythritol kinase [Pseudodesulfovibrio mercurii]|uniref:4-diphosphocytidyl-2-C-methyl-D-erythritol kinase n=1 Tax=Pseudodesulfovibrio mercurii TaxID=641491 RepID=F0JKD3_9BACT|nr:4-(cytidine 5'-diphospho)-2-C-methyl-D-erythritol kinase [Pseudodesulfovibrio mercurii]EGB16382.1 4-diphosphocytidyl-2C-methyl-D-erythritol kinase [Pseudodesulfovibrio mercurii]